MKEAQMSKRDSERERESDEDDEGGEKEVEPGHSLVRPS